MKEIWKDLKGYEGKYKISNMGKVKSKRSSELHCYDNGKGWLIVELYKDSGNCLKQGYSKRGAKRYKLHRLVAEHFVPNAEGVRFVIHLDGDKYNCKASNLRWCKSNRGLY